MNFTGEEGMIYPRMKTETNTEWIEKAALFSDHVITSFSSIHLQCMFFMRERKLPSRNDS